MAGRDRLFEMQQLAGIEEGRPQEEVPVGFSVHFFQIYFKIALFSAKKPSRQRIIRGIHVKCRRNQTCDDDIEHGSRGDSEEAGFNWIFEKKKTAKNLQITC